MDMKFFALKISSPEAEDDVNQIKREAQDLVIQQLNQLDDSLKANSWVFVQLGGDKVPWEKGLIGLARITKPPYDKGYDPNQRRNFRIKISMCLTLKKVIRRDEFRFYLDAYDAGGIGPTTKGEQNQAIKALTEKQAYAILRAMAVRDAEIAEKIRSTFPKEISEAIFGAMPCLTERLMTFDQQLSASEADDAAAEGEDGDKKFVFHTGVPDHQFARNRIIFGAPGTGKSFKMNKDRVDLLGGAAGNFERVTFHPEYSYFQFVGTYKPVSEENGDIRYTFVPGPFLRVLAGALKSGRSGNPKPYLLLIEEINRAKAAAVFGDVFQLLDRGPDGASEYGIHPSEDIKNYLQGELGAVPDDLKIPDNMFIWATMNSADQGVFPVDTAFKRRWSFEYIGVDDSAPETEGIIELGGELISWKALRKAINETMASGFRINEDKLLGPYFLSKEVWAFGDDQMMLDPKRFAEAFKSKVIMYLYEDAAKPRRLELFSGCDSSRYSSVCSAFEKDGIDIFGDEFRKTYEKFAAAEA